jgi:hypothetical protein
MGLKQIIKYKYIANLLTSIDKKDVKNTAKVVALEIDKIADKQLGKRSEKAQAHLIILMREFFNELESCIMSDWSDDDKAFFNDTRKEM